MSILNLPYLQYGGLGLAALIVILLYLAAQPLLKAAIDYLGRLVEGVEQIPQALLLSEQRAIARHDESMRLSRGSAERVAKLEAAVFKSPQQQNMPWQQQRVN